uniref:(northern house mosquito) hypothetical protein n=1 Tax=Culex pipiens TaxID=7175 RepID=A0A8D8A5F0_CULPI
MASSISGRTVPAADSIRPAHAGPPGRVRVPDRLPLEGQTQGRAGGGRNDAGDQQDPAGKHSTRPCGRTLPEEGARISGAVPRELLVGGGHVRVHSELQGVLRRDGRQQARPRVFAAAERDHLRL